MTTSRAEGKFGNSPVHHPPPSTHKFHHHDVTVAPPFFLPRGQVHLSSLPNIIGVYGCVALSMIFSNGIIYHIIIFLRVASDASPVAL